HAAQHADEHTKPIGVAFALFGLCLHLEHGWTGRQVQRAHMRLGTPRRSWPRFPLPRTRAATTVREVMAHPPGAERDQAIDAWCAAVWADWSESHDAVRA